MRNRLAFILLLFVLLAALLMPGPAAAKDLRLIRDAEIESIIRDYATPLFQAAGLSPSSVRIVLVESKDLNAFVTPGMQMFIHTGLLMQSADPLEIIGVIAHETGHIAAGHLVGRIEEARATSLKVLASYILGFGAAIATGEGGLAPAILAAGQDIAIKDLLSYTRGQEQAADQAAIRLLNGTGQSPRGMLDFMRRLSGQEVFLAVRQDPYLSTHPLTGDRITFLERAVAESPYAETPAAPDFVAMHERMVAKLVGFLESFDDTIKAYPQSDAGLPARYARAIAHYREADLMRAIPLIDGLIVENSADPYFYELKGQMLLENGRVEDSIPAYRRAVELDPDSALLRIALAQALQQMNSAEMDAQALEHVKVALQSESDNGFAWRLAAISYGRMGDTGMTALALAESAYARGKFLEAREQAVRAQKLLKENTPSWLQASDLEAQADREYARQKKK